MASSSWITRTTGFPFMSRNFDCDAGIPDLRGKLALVTGGNTGIGFETARELLKHNAKVYIACRSAARATEAIARLEADVPSSKGRVIFLPFDMCDLKSAAAAAETLQRNESRLDIVIANAGVMAWPYEIKNGVEIQFWNHLGHYALIQPLLPLLIQTSREPDSHVRIINVSSLGHTFSPKPDFSSLETVNAELGNTWARYGQSKLVRLVVPDEKVTANVLYSVSLQKHLEGENIRCLSLHPGNVHTELTRGPVVSFGWSGKIMQWASSYLAMSPKDGAKTQLFAATSPEVDEQDLKGAYLIPIATVSQASPYGCDPKLAQDLWEFSALAVKQLS